MVGKQPQEVSARASIPHLASVPSLLLATIVLIPICSSSRPDWHKQPKVGQLLTRRATLSANLSLELLVGSKAKEALCAVDPLLLILAEMRALRVEDILPRVFDLRSGGRGG